MPVYPNNVYSVTFVFQTRLTISPKKLTKFFKKLPDPNVISIEVRDNEQNVLYIDYKIDNIVTVDLLAIDHYLQTMIDEYVEYW